MLQYIPMAGKSLHKKWSFPLKISSVNVTKSAVFCGFGHIYWRKPGNGKLHFLVQWNLQMCKMDVIKFRDDTIVRVTTKEL